MARRHFFPLTALAAAIDRFRSGGTLLLWNLMAELHPNDAVMRKRPSKTRAKGFVILLLVVLAAWAWASWSGFLDSPSDASKTFLGALHRSVGDGRKKACRTGRVFAEDRDMLMARGWTGKSTITSERIVRTRDRTGRDIAYVDAQLQSPRGPISLVIVLEKDPGWCVSGFRKVGG